MIRARGRCTLTVMIAIPGMIIAAACTTGDGGARWTGAVDTLASGALLVRNPAQPLWTPEAAWSLREELRLGSADAEGPEQFTQIVGLAVDRDGRIYVLDRQAMEIRVFGSDGAFVRTIGRRGQGPGEFRNANGLMFSPAGDLWVVDPGNARYTVFDTAGSYLGEHRRQIGSFGFISTATFDAVGDLFEGSSRRGEKVGDFRPVIVRMSVDSALAVRDTIELPFRRPETFEITQTMRGRAVGMIMTLVPFSPSLASIVDPRGYLWSGSSDEYRIWQLSMDGDTLRGIELEAERVPVTAEERQKAIDGIVGMAGGGARLDWSRIPDVKPYYRRFLVDDLGYLWVWRITADDRAAFDVFDPDGRYLGQLDSGAELGEWNPLIVEGGHVIAVAIDELDVSYVVRYAIDGRAAPARRGDS